MSPAGAFTLVPVHGNGGGANRFRRMEPYLPPHVRFSPVTLPGFGGTARDPSLVRFADYASDLATRIERTPRPRIVLGHGIGGSLTLEFLRDHAPLVEGVILHAPVGARLDQRWFPRLMKLPGMRTVLQRLIASPAMRPVWTRKFFDGPVPDSYLEEFFGEYASCQAFGQMFDLITAEWFASLEPRDVKAILLWGERERVLDVGQADAFRELLPRARLQIEPDWDHFPMVDAPRAYSECITALAEELLAP